MISLRTRRSEVRISPARQLMNGYSVVSTSVDVRTVTTELPRDGSRGRQMCTSGRSRGRTPRLHNGEAAHRLGYCAAHASQSCAMQTCASVRSSLPWHTSDFRRTSSTSLAFAPRSPSQGCSMRLESLRGWPPRASGTMWSSS